MTSSSSSGLILRLRIGHTKQRFELARASKVMTCNFTNSTRNLQTVSIASEPGQCPLWLRPGVTSGKSAGGANETNNTDGRIESIDCGNILLRSHSCGNQSARDELPQLHTEGRLRIYGLRAGFHAGEGFRRYGDDSGDSARWNSHDHLRWRRASISS